MGGAAEGCGTCHIHINDGGVLIMAALELKRWKPKVALHWAHLEYIVEVVDGRCTLPR